MRLSEAILLGQPLIEHPRAGSLDTCALGMALAATGTQFKYYAVEGEWPWVRKYHDYPCGCVTLARPSCAMLVIAHLFDSHISDGINPPWTLEQLADYVRSIEPAEPGEAVSGEGPNQVTERAELLKVKAEELETMPR